MPPPQTARLCRRGEVSLHRRSRRLLLLAVCAAALLLGLHCRLRELQLASLPEGNTRHVVDDPRAHQTGCPPTLRKRPRRRLLRPRSQLRHRPHPRPLRSCRPRSRQHAKPCRPRSKRLSRRHSHKPARRLAPSRNNVPSDTAGARDEAAAVLGLSSPSPSPGIAAAGGAAASPAAAASSASRSFAHALCPFARAHCSGVRPSKGECRPALPPPTSRSSCRTHAVLPMHAAAASGDAAPSATASPSAPYSSSSRTTCRDSAHAVKRARPAGGAVGAGAGRPW